MAVIAGPFGLFGFALATMLLNMANAGIFKLNSMNLAMGLSLGAGLQAVGACIALYQGAFLGAMAFFGYAFFWISFVLIFMMSPTPAAAPDALAMGLYLVVWLGFTMCMTTCAWRPKTTWAIRIVFLTVDVLFFLLALHDFMKAAGETAMATTVHHIAGIEGIFCGFSAFYTACAEAINFVYQRNIIPLGEIEAEPPKSRTPADAGNDESAVPLTEVRTVKAARS